VEGLHERERPSDTVSTKHDALVDAIKDCLDHGLPAAGHRMTERLRLPNRRIDGTAGADTPKLVERALAGFDQAFEKLLTEAIMTAIADASRIDDCLVIRTGESAAALVTVLASMMALSPSSTRSRAAIKQTADGFRRKLAAKVRAAESDTAFSDFKNRCFSTDAADRERGGNA
jgi:hypothetical protein